MTKKFALLFTEVPGTEDVIVEFVGEDAYETVQDSPAFQLAMKAADFVRDTITNTVVHDVTKRAPVQH